MQALFSWTRQKKRATLVSHMSAPPHSSLDHVIVALHWIFENRRDNRRMSWRRIAKEAGLNPSHVDQILKKRQATVEPSTIAKIAQRWNVRIGWVMTGRPPIEPFDPQEAPDPYPSRLDTLAWAARGGTEQVVLDKVAAIRLPPGMSDPGQQWWYDAIQWTKNHGDPPVYQPPPPPVGDLPSEWAGWRDVADSILCEDRLSIYWECVIGFGETRTTIPRPEPFDRPALLGILDRFLGDHPPGKRGDLWEQWHRDAHIRHEQLRPKHPATRHRPKSMKVERQSPPGRPVDKK